MDIPYNYTIHDTRIGKDFKNITICGYKRKDVLNTFQNSIINNKLEDAIRWNVELHSTGLNKQIWNSFETIYTKYIHINNPKLFFYLLKRKKDYYNIIKKYPKKHEIFSRNNQEIRNLYAELTAILTNTKKNNMFLPKSLPPIKKDLFNKIEIKKRMISNNTDKINTYIYDISYDISSEIKLALNEIINNLCKSSGTFQNCIYWYLWLEKVQKNHKTPILSKEYVDHYTYILWKILLDFENKIEKNNFIFLTKMESIYKKDFKPNSSSIKKYYFFISFYIIKHNINWNINLFQLEYLILQTNANINSMYKSIIDTIQKDISEQSKNILSKNYYQLYVNSINKVQKIKKVKNTNLDEEINKVMFTHHPEYKDIQKRVTFDDDNSNAEKPNKKELISKNMTQRDIIDHKEEMKNKKLEVFTNFITYKKKHIENNPNSTELLNNSEIDKPKRVIDYYQQNNENSQNSENRQYSENLESESFNENDLKYKSIIFSKKK